MAMALAGTLIETGTYTQDRARQAYVDWLQSRPFDMGHTVYAGLTGNPRYDSQANGALMRISPLGIFGAGKKMSELAEWAAEDARITHPHPVCVESNRIFTLAIAQAVEYGPTAEQLYDWTLDWAKRHCHQDIVVQALEDARRTAPRTHGPKKGWVLIALHNAFWQLLYAPDPERGIIDTVMRGGDTDTNGAIAGALLGSVHGVDGLPERWLTTLRSCQAKNGDPGVRRPRPERYWPEHACSTELWQLLIGLHGESPFS
jgi:ADP-ribosylglycohydrolase